MVIGDDVALFVPDEPRSLPLGEAFHAEVSLHLHQLSQEDLGLEVVFFKRHSETELELISRHEMLPDKQDGSVAHWHCDIQLQTAGVFEYGFRLFPKHPLLAHRQDFGLVRWL